MTGAPGDAAVVASSAAERRRAFAVLFGCLMMVGIGNSALFAVLPPLARQIGLAEITVGIIYSASALAYTIMSPVWGGVSDRLGRRPVIVFGLAGSAFSMVLFAVAAWGGVAGLLGAGASVWALTAARSLFGILGSAANPAAQAWVADRTSAEDRTAAIAAMTAAFGLGAVVGPAASGLVAPYVGLIWPIAGAGLLAGLAALCAALFVTERMPPKPAGGRPSAPRGLALAFDPRLRAAFLIGCGSWAVQGASLQTVNFYLMDQLDVTGLQAAELAGLVLSAGALAVIAAQLGVVGTLKPPPRTALMVGAGATCVGCVILAVAPSLLAIAFGFVTVCFGMGLSRPGVGAALSLAVEPHEQGAAAGLSAATAGVGFLLAPLTGLALRGALGPPAPYVLGALLALACLVLAAVDPAVKRASDRARRRAPPPEALSSDPPEPH